MRLESEEPQIVNMSKKPKPRRNTGNWKLFCMPTPAQGRAALRVAMKGTMGAVTCDSGTWRALESIGWCQETDTTDWSFDHDFDGEEGTRTEDHQVMLALAFIATLAGVTSHEEDASQ